MTKCEVQLAEQIITLSIPLIRTHLWSNDDPFLYVLYVNVFNGERELDCYSIVFGMREFTIEGRDFFLNGKKILLRGGNIAFHRFLSDPQRGLLPWNKEWVKRLLIDIPKEHNFNFFRFHLGQVYSLWYDLADEYGMLIQNEWQFWRASGTKEQIIKEFTEWLEDNWNHPSIVIWDALNECSEPLVENEIIPLMKALDPTRIWEPNDIKDNHPYIYSLGPVLNAEKLGFSESVFDLESSTSPVIVNEFLWWLLNNNNEPTALMKNVIERWLGSSYTTGNIVHRQSYLAQELIELFRRIGANAIQPFVYLSNGNGATGNWFEGDIAALSPKPILETLKNAFSPLGVSIELWDRHFFKNETRNERIYVFNDLQIPVECTLKIGVVDSANCWCSHESRSISLRPTNRIIESCAISFPALAGSYSVRAEIINENTIMSYSVKPALVFDMPQPTKALLSKKICIFDQFGDIEEYLKENGFTLDAYKFENCNCCIITGNRFFYEASAEQRNYLNDFVHNGGKLILIEPEFGVREKSMLEIA